MSNFIAYHFGNYYLSSIQQGIQAAHCQIEMARKYRNIQQIIGSELSNNQKRVFWEWTKEPTTICLNGGNHRDLTELVVKISEIANSLFLPYGFFSEDNDSLNNATTNVGIIVPNSFFMDGQFGRFGFIADKEAELVEFLKSFKLAQ